MTATRLFLSLGALLLGTALSPALPDPEVEVGIQDIPPSDFSLSRDDFTMEMVTARQKLPGPGKLRTEKRAEVQIHPGRRSKF